jgi:urease accessory protein
VIGAPPIDVMVARKMTTHRQRLAIAVTTAMLVALACSPAAAHTGSGSGGFAGGFLHPLFGPDHVVAMVAVGLWGAFLGPPAIWFLPIVFPLVMAGGGVLGILGLPLPGVEIGIAISAIVLGLMVALAARPPLWVAAVLVGAFAIFHGHAHGSELPPGSDAVAFSVGFVVATGLLHLTGIAFGLLARWPAGRLTVRAAGGAIALAGLAFLRAIG